MSERVTALPCGGLASRKRVSQGRLEAVVGSGLSRHPECTQSGGLGCLTPCTASATDPPECRRRIRGAERPEYRRLSPCRFVTRRGLRKLGCRVRSKPSEGRT
jgi:hypothetical protein